MLEHKKTRNGKGNVVVNWWCLREMHKMIQCWGIFQVPVAGCAARCALAGKSDCSPRQTAVSVLLHFRAFQQLLHINQQPPTLRVWWAPWECSAGSLAATVRLLHWLVEPQTAPMNFKNFILISGIFISIRHTVLNVADSIAVLAVCLIGCLHVIHLLLNILLHLLQTT